MTTPGYLRQLIRASPHRNDGHNADGEPGDCLQTTVANLLGMTHDQVPRFARYRDSWWAQMRRFARAFGGDFGCITVAGEPGRLADAIVGTVPPRLIGAGPSPRGPWWHVALVDPDLHLVHDPHPSDLGLISVEEVYLIVPAYDPPPEQRMLPPA